MKTKRIIVKFTSVCGIIAISNLHYQAYAFKNHNLPEHYSLNNKFLLHESKYEKFHPNIVTNNIDAPDGKKFSLNFNTRYLLGKKIAIGLMYGHMYANENTVNNANSVTNANINGRIYNTRIDFGGAQLILNV